jgi:DNA helicase-2/ATP-dependent DNA helicase PcrA
MTNELLAKASEQMNAAQRTAVEWGKGPVLVLAGPGSGKTRVLTCRIARLLNSSGGESYRILGLTFTNKAADEMRTRVAALVPGQESRLFLGTFHSFCAEVLRQHGTHLGIRPNFEIYSQTSDLEAILSDVVDRLSKSSQVVSDLDKKTLPVIHRLKSLLIFPDECRQAFQDAEFGERISIVYPEYERELSARNVLDFPSLILRTFELFKRFPAFARRYRTVYPCVCVDEFQDTNIAQYQLLRMILGDGSPDLFIVADDDQIIYQWNGASHQRLQQLVADYNPTLVQLPVNYRCPAEIVALANKLIQHNSFRTPGKQALVSAQGTGGDGAVRLLRGFDDSRREAAVVAKDIKGRHAADFSAVVGIARTRRLLTGLEDALRVVGVRAYIAQRKDEFESALFTWLHAMLRLANERHSERYLNAVCGSFSRLAAVVVDPKDVVAKADASNYDYLRRWIMVALAGTSDARVKAILTVAAKALGEGRSFLTFCQEATEWFGRYAARSVAGAERGEPDDSALFNEERDVWSNLVREISATLGEDVSLEAFLQELQMRSKEPDPGPNVVALYTIHASKGKEFDNVYVIGMVEDELPSFQSKKKGDNSPEMEEERRNCFVAITRASKSLTLSYANSYNGWPKEPSRFLFEMGLLQRSKN